MIRLLFTTIGLLSVFAVSARQQDSLFVVNKNNNWYIAYKPVKDEALLTLANKYYVPAAIFASANAADIRASISANTLTYIPLGPYNKMTTNRNGKPLYYKVRTIDNLGQISRTAALPQNILESWNHIENSTLNGDETLFVGWVKYDSTGRGNDTTVIKAVVVKDTLSPEEHLYLSETNNEQNVVSEKGAAAFFDMPAKIKNSNMFYAFHSLARKGTIIKVYDPGTDKKIFVKVLGPLPATKQYTNCIIGIASGAKDALQVLETKAWVEISYKPAK